MLPFFCRLEHFNQKDPTPSEAISPPRHNMVAQLSPSEFVPYNGFIATDIVKHIANQKQHTHYDFTQHGQPRTPLHAPTIRCSLKKKVSIASALRLYLLLVKNGSSNKQRRVTIGDFRNLWIVVVAELKITSMNRNLVFCCAPCRL